MADLRQLHLSSGKRKPTHFRHFSRYGVENCSVSRPWVSVPSSNAKTDCKSECAPHNPDIVRKFPPLFAHGSARVTELTAKREGL